MKEAALEVKKSANDEILLQNNYVAIPLGKSKASLDVVGTILSNLTYYGFTLSAKSLERLMTLNDATIEEWWLTVDATLKDITGDSRKMDQYVVYKNFPDEVLEMSEAQYWFNQILMYIGLPNKWFTTEAKERKPLLDEGTLKVLHLANENSLSEILTRLLSSTTKLNKEQLKTVFYLIAVVNPTLTASSIPFKENLIAVVDYAMKNDIEIALKSATDVIRLATVLSGGELNSTLKTKFKKFAKKERRFFLNILENSSALVEDMARDRERWKRFIFLLHPSDFKNKYPKVVKAADLLYKDKVQSFNGKVETLISKGDLEGLRLSSTRGGDFMRRIRQLSSVYKENDVLKATIIVSKTLKLGQLLKLKKYLEIVNTRSFRIYPPKGNWTKVQIVNSDISINEHLRVDLLHVIGSEIALRANALYPDGVNLDINTTGIKISSSDSADYGRGTIFPIPDDVNFIRTASYWEHKGYGNSWFDNGWNFFDKNWHPVGTCCWNSNPTSFKNKAAIFSGDPTNSKEMEGKACQMIDLYLNKLKEAGVRYAVWNILCYSRVKFSQAKDVFAALQWGKDASRGKLFEPSRCQIAFPLKDDNFTKFIAYIDVEKRELVFMDANFKGDVQSAKNNESTLSKSMPAFVEYLESIPSVHDIFVGVKQGTTPILYSDAKVSIKDGQKAFVFRPENKENNFERIDINSIL